MKRIFFPYVGNEFQVRYVDTRRVYIKNLIYHGLFNVKSMYKNVKFAL